MPDVLIKDLTHDVTPVGSHKIEVQKENNDSAFSTLTEIFANNNFFATVELGHATDSTLARPAAGRMQVEGEEVLTTKDLSATLSAAQQAKLLKNIAALLHGQCRLSKSGSNLLLSPHNGNCLIINSLVERVPDAGVMLAAPSDTVTMTIASPCVVTWNNHGLAAGSPVKFSTSGALPTGITAGTTYYVIAAGLTSNAFEISATPGGAAVNTSGSQSGTHKIGTLRCIYAYMNSGTMTLEASTTTHATQAGTGVEIKSGDATRTLVGMAYDSSTAWVDSVAQRFVRSWFNRKRTPLKNNFTVDRSTTSTSLIELNSEIRVEFLLWADEAPLLCASGGTYHTNSGSVVTTALGIDDVSTATNATQIGAPGSSLVATISTGPSLIDGMSEGYHFCTLLGSTNNGTGSWYSPTVSRFSLMGGI